MSFTKLQIIILQNGENYLTNKLMTDLERVENYTKDYFERIESFLQRKKNLPQIAKSDEDCNNIFKMSDNELSDMLQAMKKLIESKRLLSFGVSFSGDFAEGSKLRSKCCNCPKNPNPYYKKNELRTKAQLIVIDWRRLAELWLKDNSKDLSEFDLRSKVSQNLNLSSGKISKKFIKYS